MELDVKVIERQVAFLQEIDKLKSVVRKSPLIDKSRKENSAEHSWHLAMYAMILHKSSNEPVNLDRVIRMLLLHDIVEIDAGDYPIHESSGATDQEELELKAAERIFAILPKDQEKELRSLWEEFESAKTSDAQFAKSLDRFQPLIQNVNTNGGTWVEGNVSHEQVEQRYAPVISAGSNSLWSYARKLVNNYFGG